jgi:hypothetical protein
MTSESKTIVTDLSFSATLSQSPSAVVPSSLFLPRQFHTPAMEIQHSPRLTAESAFLAPSVMYRLSVVPGER